MILRWLDLEKQRPPFRVLQREQDTTLALGRLQLKLRLDRVDECDGQELLIDYKSSAPSIGGWVSERLTSPQLPLYTLSTDRVGGIAYGQVKLDDCKLVGLGAIDDIAGVQSDVPKAARRYAEIENWEALQARWRDSLNRLADTFLAGDAAVDPAPRACDYCGLQALCRVELAPQQEPVA